MLYYQVNRLRLRGEESVVWPEQEDPDFFEKVHGMTLRYFHYYGEDFGLSPHLHDLEVVEMEVFLDRTEEGCHEIRVQRVTGFNEVTVTRNRLSHAYCYC